jgi:hypothetical protein
MAPNDTLDLILDDPDVVPWARLTPMIEGLEEILSDIAHQILIARGNLRATRSADPANWKRASARLAPPRSGSNILPLLFDLPDIYIGVVQQKAVAQSRYSTELWDFLSKISSLKDLAEIALLVTFSRQGLIARQTGQDQPSHEPEDPRVEHVVAHLAAAATPWVEHLLKRAEAVGPARVAIRYRDAEIELVLADRLQSNLRLGRGWTRVQVMGNNPAMAKAPLKFRRREGPTIRVRYDGAERLAFLAWGGEPGNKLIVLGRGEKDLTPLEQQMETVGDVIPRSDVEPLEDVPDSFTDAVAVYDLKGHRPATFS